MTKNGFKGFEVGDILVATWGYDQTNADFFEVVKKTPKGVWLTAAGMGEIPTKGAWNAFCRAGKKIFRRVNPEWGWVSISSFASASKWNGKPVDVTPAGFGHGTTGGFGPRSQSGGTTMKKDDIEAVVGGVWLVVVLWAILAMPGW